MELFSAGRTLQSRFVTKPVFPGWVRNGVGTIVADQNHVTTCPAMGIQITEKLQESFIHVAELFAEAVIFQPLDSMAFFVRDVFYYPITGKFFSLGCRIDDDGLDIIPAVAVENIPDRLPTITAVKQSYIQITPGCFYCRPQAWQ